MYNLDKKYDLSADDRGHDFDFKIKGTLDSYFMWLKRLKRLGKTS